jgi:uncharacterized sulfatase
MGSVREHSTGSMGTDDVAGTVLITIDSLRADALAAPGAATHAPTLAALRERGTVFENAFAHGNWTPFSFPSIMSSRPVFESSPSVGLPDSPALAEVLSRAGIETAGLNAANGFLSSHWGYDRGFDEFESLLGDETGVYSKYLTAHPTVQGWVQLATTAAQQATTRARKTVGAVAGEAREAGTRTEGGESEEGTTGTEPASGDARAAALGARGRSFLERVEEPFFLWLHYMDAHTPYLPAPRHVTAVTGDRVGVLRALRAHAHTGLGLEVDAGTLDRLRQLYRAAIRGIDASVAGVLDSLRERGLRDRTFVIVAGDHGEEFQEHGHLAHYPKLYEELIHVPLIVDHPATPPERITGAVGLDAVGPTVCAGMGVEIPREFEGRSLLEFDGGGVAPDSEPVLSVAVRGTTVTQQPIPRRLDEGELLVSARTREWTYVYHTESGRRELYRRSTDPAEQEDVYKGGADTETVARLHRAVSEHIGRIGGTGTEAGGKQAPPSSVATRLKALGYR